MRRAAHLSQAAAGSERRRPWGGPLDRLLLGHDPGVDRKACEIRQPTRDAVFLAGLASDCPAHPPLRGGIDGICYGAAGVQFVSDVVGKVAAIAAVKEVPDRLQPLAGGIGDVRDQSAVG